MAAKGTWLKDLKLAHGSNEWTAERLCYNPVVGVGRVALVGYCIDESIQQVQITQVVGGKPVFLDVIDVHRGKFNLSLQLCRGYNELVCSPFDASERSFSVNVLYKGCVREWTETLICSIMFALIIKTFIVQPFYIPSESMEDTLKVGDRIMVNRFDYLLRSPDRKDVVVFEDPHYHGHEFPNEGISMVQSPVNERRYFVKRIIGLPHEKLRIIDREVFLNGSPLKEDYLKPVEKRTAGISSLDSINDLLVVDAKNYFVMGDNRESSEDSRSWGTVPKHKIVGPAVFVWYPFSRMRWLQ